MTEQNINFLTDSTDTESETEDVVCTIVDLAGNEEQIQAESFVDLRFQCAQRLQTYTPCISLHDPNGMIVTDLNWFSVTGAATNITLRVIHDTARLDEMKRWHVEDWKTSIKKYLYLKDRSIFDVIDLCASSDDIIYLKRFSFRAATMSKLLDMMYELFQSGCISDECLGSAFIDACQYDDCDLLEFFMEHGIDVKTSIGEIALVNACSNGYTDVVQLIVKHNCDISGPVGNNALCGATARGHTDVVRTLVELSVDITTEIGNRALYIATCNHRKDIMSYFLQNGVILQKEWRERVCDKVLKKENEDLHLIFLEYNALESNINNINNINNIDIT